MAGRKRSLAAMMVAILILPVLAAGLARPPAAQAAADVASCAPDSGTGTITGTVTASGDAGSIQVTAYTSYGARVKAINVATGGTYQITGLIPGAYLLEFQPSLGGYAVEWYNNQPSGLTATPLTVTSGATTSALNVQLEIGARFSGQVKGPADELVQSAQVTLYDAEGETVTTVYTDQFGIFVTGRGVPAGSYRLKFSGPSGYLDEYYNDQPTLETATVVSVGATEFRSGLNAVLARGGSISGKVTNAAGGAPVAGASVRASGPGSGFDFTDAAGNYTISGLPSGSYTVTAGPSSDTVNLVAASAEAAVTAPGATAGVNLTLAPGGTLTGRVVGPGATPLQGITVYLSNDDGSYQEYVSTKADGIYSATGLPSGAYTVLFRPSKYIPEAYNNQPDFGLADPIIVTAPSTVSGIDAELAVGGAISGKVTEAGSGTPIKDVFVEVLDGDGGRVETAFTRADGTYTVDPTLPSGSYKVRFNADERFASCAFVTEYYSGKPDMAQGDLVSVTAPNVTANIDAAMTRGSIIFGRMTDAATGQPITRGSVRIYDASGEGVMFGRLTFLGGYRTQTALPSGTYSVQFRDNDGGYIDEFYDNKLSRGTATPVVVTAPNDVLGIDAALEKGGLISGRVTSGGGEPFTEGAVIVYDGSGEEVGYGEIASDGSYVVRDGLATGAYRVAAVPYGGEEGVGPALRGLMPTFFGGTVAYGSATPVQVTAGSTTAGINIVVRYGALLPLLRR